MTSTLFGNARASMSWWLPHVVAFFALVASLTTAQPHPSSHPEPFRIRTRSCWPRREKQDTAAATPARGGEQSTGSATDQAPPPPPRISAGTESGDGESSAVATTSPHRTELFVSHNVLCAIAPGERFAKRQRITKKNREEEKPGMALGNEGQEKSADSSAASPSEISSDASVMDQFHKQTNYHNMSKEQSTLVNSDNNVTSLPQNDVEEQSLSTENLQNHSIATSTQHPLARADNSANMTKIQSLEKEIEDENATLIEDEKTAETTFDSTLPEQSGNARVELAFRGASHAGHSRAAWQARRLGWLWEEDDEPENGEHSHKGIAAPTAAATHSPGDEATATTHSVELVVDPQSLGSVLGALLQSVSATGRALVGTIRLLPSLLIARRFLAHLAYGLSDWYTGRYLRTKYQYLELQYWRYYQIPAALRSLGRIATQSTIVMTAGRLLETQLLMRPGWWSCQPHAANDSSSSSSLSLAVGGAATGCHLWCGAAWIAAVLSVGRATHWFMSRSSSPLRLQVAQEHHPQWHHHHHHRLRPYAYVLQKLRDPESLMRDLTDRRQDKTRIRRQPFSPNPLFFPSSWQVLRILQMIAIVQQLPRSSHTARRALMRRVLWQEVLRDEWQRVLWREKRVALGIAVVACYGGWTLALFFTVGVMNGPAAVLLLPSLLAVIVSTWMNVYVYLERRSQRRR